MRLGIMLSTSSIEALTVDLKFIPNQTVMVLLESSSLACYMIWWFKTMFKPLLEKNELLLLLWEEYLNW